MRYLFYSLFLFSSTLYGQALRDINYSYLYNPAENFSFTMRPVREAQQWTILYQVVFRDDAAPNDRYVIQWETRNSLGDKESVTIGLDSIRPSPRAIAGKFSFSNTTQAPIIVAKIINPQVKRAWLFYKILDPNYPVNGCALNEGTPLVLPYVKINSIVGFQENTPLIVSYYNDDFPAALPPFSESLGRVSQAMRTDTTLHVSPGSTLTLAEKGLYLIQRDTTDLLGYSYRAEDDYPKLAKIDNLAGPLAYICTKQEVERLKSVNGEKRAFDKIVLNITGNTERARDFMRSYYRRVELANTYFTSYKEGWKTDRGMIYIIFGLPDEVYKFTDREVWSYKKNYNVSFQFTRSSTVFDPENYVLMRDKKYQQTWYEVVDLWRNARF
jgi:GWxTD domain-containing protein